MCHQQKPPPALERLQSRPETCTSLLGRHSLSQSVTLGYYLPTRFGTYLLPIHVHSKPSVVSRVKPVLVSRLLSPWCIHPPIWATPATTSLFLFLQVFWLRLPTAARDKPAGLHTLHTLPDVEAVIRLLFPTRLTLTSLHNCYSYCHSHYYSTGQAIPCRLPTHPLSPPIT